MNFGFPNIVPIASNVLLLTGERAHTIALQQRLWRLAVSARTAPGVREAVVGDGNLTLLLDRDADRSALVERLRDAWNAPNLQDPREIVGIAVRYDGEDLESLARMTGLSADDIAELHAGATYVVSFVGFQPGFGYLEGLDARLCVPRRAEPRARVPAGSVAIANGYSAIYPLDSPGGWHLIGSTDARLFDPQREPFALLEPGDRVRFRRA
jgi:KipI family sensor histidine kinase inhibitor